MGDDSTRLAAAHNAFSKLGFISSHLTLFPMPNVPDVRAHLLAQDVIWVGGGSTANLLALWRLHGLDVVLRECWEAGVVLKGVSAGSLCWHVGGTTDSFGPTLVPVTDGLAFLPYSNSPHHDVEEQRRPLIHRLIAEGTLPDGYATENGTGLVFYGTELAGRLHRGGGQGGLLARPAVRRRRDPRGGAGHPPALSHTAAAPAQSDPACTVSVSRPERSTRPGTAPVKSPSRHDLGPVHEHVPDADRLGVQPAGAARQVVAGAHGAVADGGRVEHDHVGERPRRQATAVAQPVEAGRDVGQQPHRLLPTEQAAGPHPVAQHGGRVDGAAHGVEVGAGIGAAHDRPRVLPGLRPAAPSPPRTRGWAGEARCAARRPPPRRAARRTAPRRAPGHLAHRAAFERRRSPGRRSPR